MRRDARHPASKPAPSRGGERGSARLILVGAVAGAHGVRGEVKLKSFTEDPEAIARYGPLVAPDGRTVEIVAVRTARDGLIARFRGVDTRDAAEALKGTELMVPRDRLPEADGFYHADLVGLEAFDKAGGAIGLVIGVRNYGAGDLIEIERPLGSSVLVPFTDACVPEVDLPGGRLTVDPPEGLLDD